jgi:hypothetical protein
MHDRNCHANGAHVAAKVPREKIAEEIGIGSAERLPFTGEKSGSQHYETNVEFRRATAEGTFGERRPP